MLAGKVSSPDVTSKREALSVTWQLVTTWADAMTTPLPKLITLSCASRPRTITMLGEAMANTSAGVLANAKTGNNKRRQTPRRYMISPTATVGIRGLVLPVILRGFQARWAP